MALTQEQQDIFEKHLNTYWEGNRCPICLGVKWRIDGTMGPFSWKDGTPPTSGPEAFPIVIIYCVECFYIHNFLWKPIKEKANDKEIQS